MTAILLQFVWQVDDIYGFEWAFLDAYAAPAAQFFRNKNFVFFEANCFDAAAHHGAVFYAQLIAFLWLAFVVIHYSDARHPCSVLNGLGIVINPDVAPRLF